MSWGTKLKLGGEIPKADGQEATEPGLKPDYGTAKPSLPLCISEPTPHPHHLSCCHLYLKWGQPTLRGSVPLSWTIPVIFTLLPFYLFISQKILMKAQFLPDTAFTWSTFQFNIDTAARVRAWDHVTLLLTNVQGSSSREGLLEWLERTGTWNQAICGASEAGPAGQRAQPGS